MLFYTQKTFFNKADLAKAFDTIQIGIFWAALAIAETGAIVEFATDDSMRLVTALPPPAGTFINDECRLTNVELRNSVYFNCYQKVVAGFIPASCGFRADCLAGINPATTFSE